nr:hypothetical protein [Streptomyces kronopolitis]
MRSSRSAAAPAGPSVAPPIRSPRGSSAPTERRVSRASSEEFLPSGRSSPVSPAGSAAATPGRASYAPPWPRGGIRLARTRTGAAARKSAWSSCERLHEAPWPIASMPRAVASTSSNTGPAPRCGRRLICQPASAAASPRPRAAPRSAIRAASGSSRRVSTVPASSASAGAATSTGSMPSRPAVSPVSTPLPAPSAVCRRGCQ